MARTPRRLLKSVARRITQTTHRIEYAPDGWATALPSGAASQEYWTHFIAKERTAYNNLLAHLHAGKSIDAFDADERIKYAAFGEVLRIAADPRQRLTMLDVGGNLGDYFWIGKALAPDLDLEFHCKELPDVAAVGRHLNPSVTFHTDDDCLDQPYHLIMFSSSLQLLPAWQQVLGRAARSARRYLFLSDVPTVRTVPSFVVAEHSDGVTNLQYQLNRSEIIDTVGRAGLSVAREFDMGPHPPVRNAPEQPWCIGWLFRR